MQRSTRLGLCLALAACAAVPTDGAMGVREVIERHNANAVRWYAAGDVDSLASVFAEDAWQMPPNQPPLVGREAIRAFWRQAVGWGRWDFTLDVQDVQVSGPMAVERGRYALGFTAGPDAPPGMASFEDRGNYLVHWRREADGEWRIVADAPVSELPLPTMTGPDGTEERASPTRVLSAAEVKALDAVLRAQEMPPDVDALFAGLGISESDLEGPIKRLHCFGGSCSVGRSYALNAECWLLLLEEGPEDEQAAMRLVSAEITCGAR